MGTHRKQKRTRRIGVFIQIMCCGIVIVVSLNLCLHKWLSIRREQSSSLSIERKENDDDFMTTNVADIHDALRSLSQLRNSVNFIHDPKAAQFALNKISKLTQWLKHYGEGHLRGDVNQMKNMPSISSPTRHDMNDLMHKKDNIIMKKISRIALLIITHEREEALKRCLDRVIQYHPCQTESTIVISQDKSEKFEARIAALADKKMFELRQKCPLIHTQRIVHRAQSLQGSGYHKLSRHFKFALNTVFSIANIDYCIILEEDLLIAPDFFLFFQATAPLLDTDQTLFAVSAWNDNGQKYRGRDPQRILRSDFFPGLGWMLTRNLWIQELRNKWPPAYWDDWLRESAQRKDRHVLRPELCRTFHTLAAGTGTSKGQYANFLTSIQIYQGPPIDFTTTLDPTSLNLQEYDSNLLRRLKAATLITSSHDLISFPTLSDSDLHSPPATAFRIEYHTVEDRGPNSFPALARSFRLMDNVKAGVPRSAYRGVIEFYHNGYYIYLMPPLAQVERNLFQLSVS
mmetsp:Transcript_16791/g.25247  ORF Transcript_16791/g.25247 Transcript_16791/m.25247 type:complete len:515 (-) Transcript_16791:371-1915(-)